MENASKALIIAGAILLAIAIIGIGMYVFQMASGTINQANMSAQEVDAYNAEFTKYEGTQNGSTVQALCNAIISHNNANEDNSKKVILTETACTGATVKDDGETKGTTSTEITTIKKTINSGTRYDIAFDYTSTGLIKTISIVKHTTNT